MAHINLETKISPKSKKLQSELTTGLTKLASQRMLKKRDKTG